MAKGKDCSTPLDWSAQLVMLRAMTQRFNTLHEAQVLQLRLWPFTVDNTLKDSQAQVDFECKIVKFDWKTSTLDTNDKKYRKRLTQLANNVKFLLGDAWLTEVFLDGTLIYPLDTNDRKSSNRSRNRKRKTHRTSQKRNKKRR